MRTRLDQTFQEPAVEKLHKCVKVARNTIEELGQGYALSFTAPTGAGKTIMMAAFIEEVLTGTINHPADKDAIFLWLSDSPELNAQTCDKFIRYADKLTSSQLCVIDNTFDAEELSPGMVYFLNTQKLASGNTLVTPKDGRNCLIWETLTNTIDRYGSHLYLVIDEAHRGALSGQKNQLPIMQKFVKGSSKDGLMAFPLVIGVTATPERFDALITGMAGGSNKIIVSTNDVRGSGLIKDRILLDAHKSKIRADEALFADAVDDWIDKANRWHAYCKKHAKKDDFDALLVVQVENEAHGKITQTDLGMCMRVLQGKLRRQIADGEVVHTFGGHGNISTQYGLIREIEPSKIHDDVQAKVVFFKENLSTGWDCPRAETMVSFRVANDPTYIAQILGRIIRTPLRRKIEEDAKLNDVSLFVPYFDEKTTEAMVKALHGGLPAEVVRRDEQVVCARNPACAKVFAALSNYTTTLIDKCRKKPYRALVREFAAMLDRDQITVGLNKTITKKLLDGLDAAVKKMKADGTFAQKRQDILDVVRQTSVLQYGGNLVTEAGSHMVQVADADIDNAYLASNVMLGGGLGYDYVRRHLDAGIVETKIEVVILAHEEAAMQGLEDVAQKDFYDLHNKHSAQITRLDDSAKDRYRRLDRFAAHPVPISWTLPPEIDATRNDKSADYMAHLYCDAKGEFPVVLNSWEKGVLNRYMNDRPDFCCWLRNVDRKSWSFVIPYEQNNVWVPMYPDLIVALKDGQGFIFDILEPHDSSKDDNWCKAVGMAKYALNNPGKFGRIMLIREVPVASGGTDLKGLDMADIMVRNAVLSVSSNNALNSIFEDYAKSV